MKNWPTKKIIGFGLGMTVGTIIYDYFSYDSIDWIRSIFVGVFSTIGLFLFIKISNEWSSNRAK